MFETLVLVCMIGTSNICHTLADLEGPYKTKQECLSRAYEIAADLPAYMPNFQAMKYKCVEIEDDEDKVRTNYGNETKRKYEGVLHKEWRQTTH